MTTLDLPPGINAALVHADRPPDLPGERTVDVRPGAGASFDGTRVYAPIHVTCPGVPRKTYDNHDTAAIVSAAKTHLRKCDAAFLRLGNRVWLRDIWSAGTVGTIERRLVATARREGVTLVTWTDAGRRSADDSVYDLVVSR